MKRLRLLALLLLATMACQEPPTDTICLDCNITPIEPYYFP